MPESGEPMTTPTSTSPVTDEATPTVTDEATPAVTEELLSEQLTRTVTTPAVTVSVAGAAPAATEVVFEVREFSAFYGSFRAVRDIELDIPKHRITAFIGPSGCGKSTLLRCFNRMND